MKYTYIKAHLARTVDRHVRLGQWGGEEEEEIFKMHAGAL
jgi:hypothetical protein